MKKVLEVVSMLFIEHLKLSSYSTEVTNIEPAVGVAKAALIDWFQDRQLWLFLMSYTVVGLQRTEQGLLVWEQGYW